MPNPPYEAVLLVSFGGPEGPDDVLPFLDNVLRGRNVPRERLLEVAAHYQQFGGVSPINAQNRALIAALKAELKAQGVALPIYWGNRNWRPYLADAIREMRDAGVRRALALVTSAFSSYSGCRQYLENIEQARREVGAGAPEIDKLRGFYNHPEFIAAVVDRIAAAYAQLPAHERSAAPLVFTAHSIPLAMAAGCDYERELRESCNLASAVLQQPDWHLAYQSRSGPPSQPWLEPDVRDLLRQLHKTGTQRVVVVPIGFLSDHMEVVYDLDVEARQVCDELGMRIVRAATVGTHPRFIAMLCELIQERLDPARPRRALGECSPRPDQCAADCCPSGRPAKTSS